MYIAKNPAHSEMRRTAEWLDLIETFFCAHKIFSSRLAAVLRYGICLAERGAHNEVCARGKAFPRKI